MPPNYDKNKHNSDIFVDMIKYAKELLNEPEITEKAIKDRNVIIKALKCEIEHRKLAFKEVEDRYDIILLKNKEYNNKILEITKQNTELEKKLKDMTIIFNELSIKDEYSKIEYKKSISYKFDLLSEKVPTWAGKAILKMLSSSTIQKNILIAFFCLLFVASFTGWSAILSAISPLIHALK